MTTATVTPLLGVAPQRTASRRHYLMCAPTFFEVRYAINPWMRLDVPVDRAEAIRQWEHLRETYRRLGHVVETLEPLDGLPDMVFAANGGVVVDGRAVASRFRHAERAGEQLPYARRLTELGVAELHHPQHVLEGEGDVVVTDHHVLVASGFRSDPGAADELAARLAVPTGRSAIALELVDPRFYHLDTALGLLDERTAVYLPSAFSAAACDRLAEVFDELIPASETDAGVLGLNLVSDGRNVVLEAAAEGLAGQLADRGFVPHGVPMGELRKAGGAVKCCTMELRGLLAPGATDGAETQLAG